MAEATRESVPIERIAVEGTQTRESIRSDVVAEYAEIFSELPPIRVFFDGLNFWLSDGFHRLEAARKSKKSHIPAEVFQGGQRDAIMDAVGANETHGLRRSNDDRRRAVRLLLDDEEWCGWANTEIARQCNVSEYFVRTVKNEIGFDEREEDEARPRKTTRKGKQVTVRTKSIGKGRQKSPKEPKPPADEQLAPVAEPVEEQPFETVTSIESKFDGDQIGAEVSELPEAREESILPEAVVSPQDVAALPTLLDVWDSADEEAREWFIEQRYDAIIRIMQQVERGRTEDEPHDATAADADDASTQSPIKTTQPALIMNILSAASKPMSREQLLEHKGINERQLGRNLSRLVKGGKIAKSDDDRYSFLQQR